MRSDAVITSQAIPATSGDADKRRIRWLERSVRDEVVRSSITQSCQSGDVQSWPTFYGGSRLRSG